MAYDFGLTQCANNFTDRDKNQITLLSMHIASKAGTFSPGQSGNGGESVGVERRTPADTHVVQAVISTTLGIIDVSAIENGR